MPKLASVMMWPTALLLRMVLMLDCCFDVGDAGHDDDLDTVC